VKTLREVLKPTWSKLSLFTLFIAIAIGGEIQAWGFSDVHPNPPLYDLLEPFPLWPIWMYLLIPLALFTLPLRIIGIDLFGGPPWIFFMSNILYFYLLSCIMVTVINFGKVWWKSRQNRIK
jgi:hypothetical protein